ncbi:MAG TPA: LysR substrate-binding domain-containing protein [Burkholderiales bacterium]|nr:LysR substrate-binding domain-containing protein [Burkholderiales bacterium]
MSDRLPSLDLLKGFEAVARHLSFTKAAAELFVTQSAVSRQVRQLEAHLGVRLFERRTRAVVLTEAGHLYYSELAPLLTQIADLTRRVAGARAEIRVRVTATLTFAGLWLVPRLAEFQESHPEIQVHVVADNVVRDLVRDDFDLAIRYCSEAIAGPGALTLFGETLTPVCSPQLLARAPLRSVEDLERHVLIHYSDLEGRGQWLSWDAFLARLDRDGVRGKGAAHFSHYDQAIRAARAAQGVVLGRLPVIDAAMDEGLVAPLAGQVAVTVSERAYWLVRNPQRAPTPEVGLFVDWITKEAARSAAPRKNPGKVRVR